MAKIHTPHDRVCKAALSDIRVAKGILQNYLPEEISKMIAFDTLQITDSSFVGEHMQKLESDILFKADINGSSGYIYTLIEHQSTPDKLMPVRLFSYMAAVFEHAY
ncbi:MAG: hypothetical protein COC15_00910 [Legionellales bacterium]|nr:MAG: hypothetical protein COC15_00910 [Legionellales bacterium]